MSAGWLSLGSVRSSGDISQGFALGFPVSADSNSLMLDLDGDGKVVSLTVEHAAQHSGKMDFSYEATAA